MRLSSKLYIIPLLIVAAAAAAFIYYQTTSEPPTMPFPDQVYLKTPSSLNGEISFKARVVSQIGQSHVGRSIRFSAIETVTREPIDLVVILPENLESVQLLPGQIFKIVAYADRGNMFARELIKF